MALAAVTSALDDGVKAWLIYWRRAGAPESAAEIVGEVGHPEPPTYTEAIEYLARDATKGTIACVPMDDCGNVVPHVARVEFPIARRAAEPAAGPVAAPDMEKLMAGIGNALQNAIAPLAQRLSELEQRNAAAVPVANAMGMGLDPFAAKLLDRLLAPPPPPARSALEERMLDMAFTIFAQPPKVDRVAQMTDTLMQLRMQREIKNEMQALADESNGEDKDEKEGEGIDMVGVLREGMSMLASQRQAPASPTQAQPKLSSPGSIFDDAAALESAIAADPDKAMNAMKVLARNNPAISAIARKVLREGENEAKQ